MIKFVALRVHPFDEVVGSALGRDSEALNPIMRPVPTWLLLGIEYFDAGY